MSTEEKSEKPQEPEVTRNLYVIDLNKIEDRLPTNWWNKLDPYTFGFWTRLPLLSYCRVKESDILIQKQKREGDRFITVHYYQIIEGKPEFMGLDNNRVKNFLSTTVLQYIMKYKQLPYACRYAKEFKNGNVQIDFTPTKWDNYAIHVTAKSAKLLYDIDDLMEVVHDLKSTENNPAIKRKKTTPIQGVKRLSKEEYKKKMQKIDENEYMADLLKPETDSDTQIESKPIRNQSLELTQDQKARKIEDILAHLDDDDEDIEKPYLPIPPPPPQKSIDPNELISFIKTNDKGQGVSKMVICEKFGVDPITIMKSIDVLMNKLLIYKVKPSFYSAY